MTALPLEAIDAYEVVHPAFNRLRGDVGVRRIASGQRWAEGPVYVPAGRYLLWSDIPNNRLMRWDETDGTVSVFRESAGFPNGNALDAHGRLITCEQGLRRIVRTEHDARRTVLADTWDGRRLNSPNDLAVAADGAVWFTDAAYGIDSDYEGIAGDSEIGACNVYRIDQASGRCELVADGFERPTGIAFSPTGERLYVADSRANHLRAFAVDGDTVTGGAVIAANSDGNVDSMAVDRGGRVWLAAGGSVLCLTPDGELIGRLRLPESASNVEFGGARRNCLFITASTSVYSIMLTVNGAARAYEGEPA